MAAFWVSLKDSTAINPFSGIFAFQCEATDYINAASYFVRRYRKKHGLNTTNSSMVVYVSDNRFMRCAIEVSVNSED